MRDTLKTVKILGNKVEIRVDDDGMFSAYVAGESRSFDTLKALLADLHRFFKKMRVTVSVPVTILNVSMRRGHGHYRKFLGSVSVHATMTGLNPKTNAPAFLFDGDKDVHYETESHRDVLICRRMPDEQMKEFAAIKKAQRDADNRFYAFEKKWKMADPEEVVKAAMSLAADDPKEDDETV